MKDLQRISNILKQFEKIWMKVPEWRFMQVLTVMGVKQKKDFGFYTEDKTIEDCLGKFEKYIEKEFVIKEKENKEIKDIKNGTIKPT